MKINHVEFFLTAILSIHLSCAAPAHIGTREPKLEGVAYILLQVDLREERNLTSRTIIIIESGEEVSIIDNSDAVFYKIKYKEHSGYVSKNYLTKTRPQKSSYSSPSPTYKSTTTTAKDCATVQCSGTTKKGERCKNKTTNCNGRCHLH